MPDAVGKKKNATVKYVTEIAQVGFIHVKNSSPSFATKVRGT